MACYTLGLAVSVYLAALKLFALPCVGPGNCQTVIYSAYGSVAGVPVGVFGALLWTAILTVRDEAKRGALLFLVAAGALVFMVLQFGVLRSFCLYCTLHAVVAWGALLLNRERPRLWVLPLGLLVAAAGFLGTRQYIAARALPEESFTPKLASLASNPAGLAWIGAIHPRSPALVISLDCASCLDLLQELTAMNFSGRSAGPALYLKTNDANYTLSVVFTAAVLSQGDLPKRDAFLAVVGALLAEKPTLMSDPEAAAVRLASMFPDAAAHQNDAKAVLAAQARTLEAAGANQATPLLIRLDGRTSAFFSPAELFP